MSATNNNEPGREFDWNDTIEKESEFILIPDGDYDFTVKRFERARHAGSDKLPPCNKAVLYLEFTHPAGTIELKDNLFLHTTTEGMLSSFFSAIGQKKKGEKLQMNWNSVPGSTGRAKIGVCSWKGDDGETRQSNEIKKYYPKDNSTATQPFEAGRF